MEISRQIAIAVKSELILRTGMARNAADGLSTPARRSPRLVGIQDLLVKAHSK
jgi:hypothetical protein